MIQSLFPVLAGLTLLHLSSVQPGDFVRLRGRRWLVEDQFELGRGLTSVRVACVDDDAQGETADVILGAELDAEVLGDEGWDAVARTGTDDPTVFAAYLRTLGWSTATAADRDLFQAPFRAGIRLDAYQLLPLRKALRLPRVNLLIADDVGAGKTVEAGLVLREMMLRRRVDFALVAAPAGMVRQWQDELEAKFGLSFVIVDREHLAALRRERGFSANPWTAGSLFIISHSLLVDDTYVAGLRDALGEFRPRAMMILDEAHHAAPASGARYAVDSQLTKAVRDLAGRFEHRLFLSATPHNGHSNSFSSLLEILDPQRFTRGVPVRPRGSLVALVDALPGELCDRAAGTRARIELLPPPSSRRAPRRKAGGHYVAARRNAASIELNDTYGRDRRPSQVDDVAMVCEEVVWPRSPIEAASSIAALARSSSKVSWMSSVTKGRGPCSATNWAWPAIRSAR